MNETYKGLPYKVFVGPYTFKIVLTSFEKGCFDLEHNLGMTVFQEFVILLRDDLTPQAALNTVLHEISHCINWTYGVTDESTEEQFCQQHSNGILEVWIRNPRLLSWQTKTLNVIKKDKS